MGSDRRQFFNQLVNLGALSGLAAMLPSDLTSVFAGPIPTETALIFRIPDSWVVFLSSMRRSTASPAFPIGRVSSYHDSAAIGQAGNVECSLVTKVEGAAPGTSFGHIVEVPGFGRVSLANLKVDNAFHLAMVEVNGGPGGVQSLTVPSGSGNGNTQP
jgi:hypothetical protein